MRRLRYVFLLVSSVLFCTVNMMGANIGHDVIPSNGVFTWANAQYGTAGDVTTFTLTGNCNVTNSMNVEAGTVVFDLNGYIFASATGGFNLFKVQPGAILIIRDSRGGGAITGNKFVMKDGKYTEEFQWHTAAFIYVNGGTFNLESGIIRNFKQNMAYTSSADGCAVWINKSGVFNMSGGTIDDCGFNLDNHYGESGNTKYLHSSVKHHGGAVYIDENTGKFNFSGGTISNCTSYRGGAVYVNVQEGGNMSSNYGFHMSGEATIDNCVASFRGGAVYIQALDGARGYFRMDGGTIKNCKSRSAGCGVHVKGVFEMYGGEIKGNAPEIDANLATTDYTIDYSREQLMPANTPLGGGICAEGRNEDGANYVAIKLNQPAVVNIYGGTISGNVAASGGGVMAYDNSELTISGVEIRGNHALGYRGTGNGGAVYANNATFTFNGGTLSGNKARRYGGAININDGSQMTLSGICTISGNQAGHGGGISQEAGECNMNLTSGGITIENNTAIGCYEEILETKVVNGEKIVELKGYNYKEGNGGGLFIERGTLNISGGRITANKANGSGGGIALRSERLSGDITLTVSGNVEISNNIANNDRASEGTANVGGNGGGIDIYSEPSNDIETVITANILGGVLKGNSADNGGGISVYINSLKNEKNSARVSLGEGADAAIIESNTANFSGGGLYVFNNTDRASSVEFSGGDILKNISPNGMGGGICVEGSVNLTTTGTNVKNNGAKNGGGIYLSGGASMIFNGGLICNNKAEGTVAEGYATAYQNDANNAGVGGGIYLASNSTLKFFNEGVTPSAFGVYGNAAATAADDIFATGRSTSIQLPKVSGMSLAGFDVPTTELYWVEDYVVQDTEYTNGTKVNGSYTDGSASILRYRYALSNFRDINKISFQQSEAAKTYTSYVCLALGYEQYYVNLLKKGLKRDDSAIFKVSYLKDGNYIPYRTVLFHRTTESDTEGVKASVVLTAGNWKFEEDTAWSGKKYKLSGVSSNLPEQYASYLTTSDKDFTVTIGSDVYTQLRSENKNTFEFTITNTSDGKVLPPSAESAVTNRIPTAVAN